MSARFAFTINAGMAEAIAPEGRKNVTFVAADAALIEALAACEQEGSIVMPSDSWRIFARRNA